jgi:hypothetical protein
MTMTYQARGKAGRVTRATPRQAALDYFAQFPASRKCDVQEGKSEGGFFTVTFTITDRSTWPQHWDDVTKKTALALPDVALEATPA